MNVGATGSMQQVYGVQGQGQQGQGGMMKEIMQQIPQEDRSSLREKMQSMSETERKDMMSQVNELDTANMSIDELTASLLDIFNTDTEEEKVNEDALLDVYA